ncbi:retrovirus-related pol polyprotein from transposon TNT 1-94 [Tanacetum coccineum]
MLSLLVIDTLLANEATSDQLAKQDLVRGLPKLKYAKDHLCSACQMGKCKKESHKPKPEQSLDATLHTLHMDLCGPMRAESINRKSTKYETPEMIIKFLKQAQVSLQATIQYLCTDNDIEFINQTLRAYTDNVGITHQTSVTRTPQQNSVGERRNRKLVEAARTMFISINLRSLYGLKLLLLRVILKTDPSSIPTLTRLHMN